MKYPAPPPIPAPPPASKLSDYEICDDYPIPMYDAEDIAMELVDEADAAQSPEEKLDWCLEALGEFPFCVGAYNSMGRVFHTKYCDLAKARECYEHGLTCARLIYPGLEEQEMIEWGYEEHRPYLRLWHYYGLAASDMGDSEKAMECYRFLLDKNPRDNQGIRHLAFDELMGMGNFDEAESMVEKYSNGRKNDETIFRYGFVLIDFHKFLAGECSKSDLERTLVKAYSSNLHVALLLANGDEDELPKDPFSFYSKGHISEAMYYFTLKSQEAWSSHPGNPIGWLQGLSMRDGLKPPDGGKMLFDLMAENLVSVVVRGGPIGGTKIMIVTSDVTRMSGKALDGFCVPPGMAAHNPKKPIVCFVVDEPGSRKSGYFTSFRYKDVLAVPFWSVQKSIPNPRRHYCGCCYNQASMKCGRCQSIYYCSGECQRKHWKAKHKKQCPNFIKT